MNDKETIADLTTKLAEAEKRVAELAVSNTKYIHDNKAVCERAAEAENQNALYREALEKTKEHSLAFVECSTADCKCGAMIQIGMFADATLEENPALAPPECKTCRGAGQRWWDIADEEFVTLSDACQMPESDIELRECPDCKGTGK